MDRLAVPCYTVTSAVGRGLADLNEALGDYRSGLRRNDFPHCDLDTWIGRVDGIEEQLLPSELSDLDSRNNRLAWLGLQQDGLLDQVEEMKRRVSPERFGLVMGTSTSSIERTEAAYRDLLPNGEFKPDYVQPEVHNLHAPGHFVARATGIEGPCMTLSTACSTSIKVFASASRWISHGLVDAVLLGGIDSLCLSVLYGFNSLELVSRQPCRPFDRERSGINIGEAAGYALVCRPELAKDARHHLLGYGESSDAHHMSHPHPEGKGAVLAMQQALSRSGLSPNDIDYVNLHGTASQANDQVETLAMKQVFGSGTPASSTKGWTGHCLGAAGILETIITLESMRNGLLPGTLYCTEQDADSQFEVLSRNLPRKAHVAMTNSFGFGGTNASAIFGYIHD